MSEEEVPKEEGLRTQDVPTKWVQIVSWGLSLVAHVGILSLAFLSPQSDADFDVKWLTTYESLERIGHGEFKEVVLAEPAGEPEPDLEPDVEPIPEPEPELEVEAVKPEPTPEPTPEPKARPEPKPASTKTESEVKPKPKEATKEEPKSPFEAKELPGTRVQGPSNLPDLRGYGPGNAVFTALLRTDRLRGTAFEPSVRRMIQMVPDYRIALDNTSIDPVSDLDSMFMASSRPQYIQYTFLAVRHQLSETEMQERLSRRFEAELSWTQFRNFPVRDLIPTNEFYEDPRKILLRPGLAVLARPEMLSELVSALPEDSDLRGGSKAEVSLLDGLFEIERAAPEENLLLVSASGASLVVPGFGRVRLNSVRLAVSHPDAPKVNIDLQFEDELTASRFSDSCPKIRSALLQRAPAAARMLLQQYVAALSCESSDSYVNVKAEYTVAQLEQLLGYAMMFAIPQPMVLSKLPKPPPPKPPAADVVQPDAGNPDTDEPDAGKPTNPAEPTKVEPEAHPAEGGASTEAIEPLTEPETPD